uniref:F-box domain-containing protein n=1 Tax=Populus davidiana TaxID=266767 RepID=A0A6M2FB13_9ROSI
MGPPPGSKRSPPKKRSSPTSIRLLEHDTLCIIFSYLGLFDVVRSSAVCKFWNEIIKRSKLLQLLYLKQQRRSSRSDFSEESLNVYLEELAIEHQRQSLVQGSLHIDQWKGHSLGVDQCRMKRGLVLTGVGDKVMRLWSLESYKCIEEYSIPDGVPLVDFDFDESKIVGLVGTRICIWRRNGQRSIFPSREGQFMKGSCMRYFDPEAVVGCEDGTARVFDMYSKKCSRIIRMHTEPVTCLSLSEDQLIISGSSLGRITVSGLSSDQRVATLRPTDSTGIKSLCFNPVSHLVFAGTTAGYASCWDLRTMRQLWKTRVSPNVVYSLQHMRSDTSTLVVGGIDGVLRVLDQNTGEVLSSYVMDHGTSTSSGYTNGVIERKIGKRLPYDYNIDRIPKTVRPPITCLAVGMQKVITTHNIKNIRMWKFNNLRELK